MPTTVTTNRAQEVVARCLKLASFSEVPAPRSGHFYLRPCMIVIEKLPVDRTVRYASAHRCRRESSRDYIPAAKADGARLLIGSHLDTVPNAGAYDGILGVALAVALLAELAGTAVFLLPSK